MPFIELLKAPDSKRFHPVEDGVTLGRGPECSIQLFGQGLSRVHLQFVCEDGQFFVVDKKSSNGTSVNGEHIRRAEIAEGDEIKAGGVLMRFSLGDCPDEPETGSASS